MIAAFGQRVSVVLLAAVPATMVAAILASNAQETSMAGVFTLAGLVLAIASTVWAAASRTSRAAVLGAMAVGVAVLFAGWLFLASWTVTTGFGSDPDCVGAGFNGPSTYQRLVFPTSLWCASADGTERVLMTPFAESVGWTVVGGALIAAAIALAAVLAVGSHRASAEPRVSG